MKKLSPKERGLVKGSLRRIFSRSDLRRSIIEKYTIGHADASRPRVKKWGWCAECCEVLPRYTLEVDHICPVVRIGLKLEDMTSDQLIDAIWCDEKNLRAVCKSCHKEKTKLEAKLRRESKKNV